MIQRISHQNIEYQNKKAPQKKYVVEQHIGNKNTSFKGFLGIPADIVNVSIIDLFTAILPRTWVDAKTNGFAAAETFRRESSGLIVNCLIPGFIVLGVAKVLELINPKNKGMASKWANENAITTLNEHFVNAKGGSRAFTHKLLSDVEVLNGTEWKKLKDFNLETERMDFAKVMANASATKKDKNNAILKLQQKILDVTGGSKNVRIAGKPYHSDLHMLLRDAMEVGQDFIAHKRKAIKSVVKDLRNVNSTEKSRIVTEAVNKELAKYFKSSKNFINKKSFIGLAITIPLAASMQSINRWITKKTSGQEGAPIYKDFGAKNKKKQMTPAEKSKFFLQKLASAGLMIGVAYASLKDKSSIKNIIKGLQFTKNMPTMDQCRWIATATFASRMLASEDANELKEVTWRDIATFSSLYFLGDYVAKAVGSLLQKTAKIPLLNYTKKAPAKSNNAIKNFVGKISHWTSGTELKTFSEAANVSKKAKAMRYVCEASSLGFSMLILGMLVPWYVRKQTEKKVREEAMKRFEGFNMYPSITQNDKKRTFQAFGMLQK